MISRRCLVSLADFSASRNGIQQRTKWTLGTSSGQRQTGNEISKAFQLPRRSLHCTSSFAFSNTAGRSGFAPQDTAQHSTRQNRSRFRIPFLLGILLSSYGLWVLTVSDNALDDPAAFKQFQLEARDDVSSSSALFTIRPLRGTIIQPPADQIWSVEFKQPFINIGRDYTVLPSFGLEDQRSDGTLKFLIRRNSQGEMSKYLYSLPIGATIGIRGPKTEFKIPQQTQQLVFFAGGTGIAPALQAANVLLSREISVKEADLPTVHILWANRHREDCKGATTNVQSLRRTSWLDSVTNWISTPRPEASKSNGDEVGPIVRELERLKTKYPGRVTVEYFIDEEGSYIDGHVVQRVASSGSISKNKSSFTQVIVSGPEGFVNYIAGPKALQFINAKSAAELQVSQGPIGGLLGQVGIDKTKAQVFKL